MEKTTRNLLILNTILLKQNYIPFTFFVKITSQFTRVTYKNSHKSETYLQKM